ncbi:carbonic anhydrase/acetyltransferase-like protein (isoleucine patch superfamily) [Desulfohalotomaculum tongense]|uniref:gamma carbonic anhydrase family protein n=1 Tax=Desulforadius tongensis TaxID=1216062 RepID=UPI0019569092|nr:gamma carbonic anhydrase family protein [Desulforadius tongensis]MBM7856018.1 carbonic anhydrase/acetyltransferase-like protein (isoleucine patch superfamily) [Desulforadius tongensis]
MIYSYGKYHPKVHPSAYIAPGAAVVGRVTLEENVSIWFNAVVRGDVDEVIVGANSNIQDCCVLHQETGYPCIVGKNVTVGHGAVLHGCTIEDNALIGMGAVVLNGARVGAGAVIGAGALVTQNQVIPPNTLALGSPAKVVRELRPEEIEEFSQSAGRYHKIACVYKNEE